MRREFSKKVKVKAFQRAAGKCDQCRVRLMPGRIEYDHRVPDALGGEPILENCEVLCRPCHTAKTARDAGNLARALRREAAFIGAKAPSRNPLPGSRRSPWKKRMDGSVVLRGNNDR